ncbi:phage tail protein [Escherichia coli]
MATKYYAVLTNVGAAKLANATALGAQVEITQMAVGDGNGVLPTPNPAQTALVHELRRKPLNSLSIDPNNANQIIAEQVIPEDEGGWWIREIGLFDKDGDMIAVANCAETYKPQLQEGSGRVQVVRMILIVSSTAAVTLKIDPSVVLATRQYVDDQIIQVKSYVDQKMAAHVAAADPHKQYAPKESPALTGRPTAPTAEGKDSSTQIANTAFVQAAIAALVGSSPEALDTLNELAAALGNDPNFATTVTNSLAGKMDKSANGSDIENVSVFLQNLGLGGAAKSNVTQATGASTTNVMSQKAVSDMGSDIYSKMFGVGMTFRDVTAERTVDTNYVNSSLKPRVVYFVGISAQATTNALTTTGKINDKTVVQFRDASATAGDIRSFILVVPPGASYSCGSKSHVTSGFNSWFEWE